MSLFGRTGRKTDSASPMAQSVAQTPAELRAAEDAAAKAVAECERNLEHAGRALELVESRHLAAIAEGVSGPPLARLSAERDALEQRVASVERDLALARTARKAAAGQSEAAGLAGKIAVSNDEQAAALRGIEESLRAVPARWAAWELAFAKGRALNAELEKFQRRFPSVPVVAPSAGDCRLTPDLLTLAKSVGPALAALAIIRAERAHPVPNPEVLTPGILVGGDSERAKEQRRSLASRQPPAARTRY